MADYYVTTTGSDANAGTTEGTAFATPGKAAATATASGDRIWIKGGTYTLTSAIANANGGPMQLSAGVVCEGYQSTIGDLAARPVISAGAVTGITICSFATPSFNNRRNGYRNIEADGNNGALNNGFAINVNYSPRAELLVARNCVDGFVGSNNCRIFRSAAINCSNYGYQIFDCVTECYEKGSGVAGYYWNQAVVRSISHGANIGFNMYRPIVGVTDHCIAYGCTSHGFFWDYDIAVVTGCIAVNNGGYGFSFTSANRDPCFSSNVDYNNTSGRSTTIYMDENPITLTGDPFVAAASGNFALNNVAGAGASCRDLQFNFVESLTSQYLDAGLQHLATGGTGVPHHPFINEVLG